MPHDGGIRDPGGSPIFCVSCARGMKGRSLYLKSRLTSCRRHGPRWPGEERSGDPERDSRTVYCHPELEAHRLPIHCDGCAAYESGSI